MDTRTSWNVSSSYSTGFGLPVIISFIKDPNLHPKWRCRLSYVTTPSMNSLPGETFLQILAALTWRPAPPLTPPSQILTGPSFYPNNDAPTQQRPWSPFSFNNRKSQSARTSFIFRCLRMALDWVLSNNLHRNHQTVVIVSNKSSTFTQGLECISDIVTKDICFLLTYFGKHCFCSKDEAPSLWGQAHLPLDPFFLEPFIIIWTIYCTLLFIINETVFFSKKRRWI